MSNMELIKKLRDTTGSGIVDCKKALFIDCLRLSFLLVVIPLTYFYFPEMEFFMPVLAGYLLLNLGFLYFLHSSFSSNKVLT